MSSSRACAGRRIARRLAMAAVLGGLPILSASARLAREPTPAEQLRHGPGITNHPVNVIPPSDMRIPDGWPVQPDGSITCLTCHEGLPPRDGKPGKDFLRGTGDQPFEPLQFCARCHASVSGRADRSLHWMAISAAHPRGEESPARPSASSLDQASKRCLGCHDGVTASESSHTTRENPGAAALGDISRSHPVGVEYRQNLRPGTGSPLRPSSLLPPDILLPEGKVSCISCHDPYRKTPDLLTVPIEESKLCLSCHNL